MQIRFLILFCCIVSGAFCAGCATPPAPRPLSIEERIHNDNVIGLKLAQGFETRLRFKQDKEVQGYLQRIAQSLAANAPELRTSSVEVLLFNNPDKSWQNFSLPGNRIYLSIELLKQARYENELASAIAFEFAHILSRHALLHFEAGNTEYSGRQSLFAYSEADLLKSVRVAIDLLYEAGYDSRGMISLWRIYEKNPGNSPFEPGMISKLSEASRQAIMLRTPLRNPVVQTSAFIQIEKRIKQL